MLIYEKIPPFTFPLVLIADSEEVVIRIIISDMNIITKKSNIPASAKIHGIFKKSITPHILSKHGTSTPLTHPNFIPGLDFVLNSSS